MQEEGRHLWQAWIPKDPRELTRPDSILAIDLPRPTMPNCHWRDLSMWPHSVKHYLLGEQGDFWAQSVPKNAEENIMWYFNVSPSGLGAGNTVLWNGHSQLLLLPDLITTQHHSCTTQKAAPWLRYTAPVESSLAVASIYVSIKEDGFSVFAGHSACYSIGPWRPNVVPSSRTEANNMLYIKEVNIHILSRYGIFLQLGWKLDLFKVEH